MHNEIIVPFVRFDDTGETASIVKCGDNYVVKYVDVAELMEARVLSQNLITPSDQIFIGDPIIAEVCHYCQVLLENVEFDSQSYTLYREVTTKTKRLMLTEKFHSLFKPLKSAYKNNIFSDHFYWEDSVMKDHVVKRRFHTERKRVLSSAVLVDRAHPDKDKKKTYLEFVDEDKRYRVFTNGKDRVWTRIVTKDLAEARLAAEIWSGRSMMHPAPNFYLLGSLYEGNIDGEIVSEDRHTVAEFHYNDNAKRQIVWCGNNVKYYYDSFSDLEYILKERLDIADLFQLKKWRVTYK